MQSGSFLFSVPVHFRKCWVKFISYWYWHQVWRLTPLFCNIWLSNFLRIYQLCSAFTYNASCLEKLPIMHPILHYIMVDFAQGLCFSSYALLLHNLLISAQITNSCLFKCVYEERLMYSNEKINFLGDCSNRVTDCHIEIYQSWITIIIYPVQICYAGIVPHALITVPIILKIMPAQLLGSGSLHFLSFCPNVNSSCDCLLSMYSEVCILYISMLP